MSIANQPEEASRLLEIIRQADEAIVRHSKARKEAIANEHAAIRSINAAEDVKVDAIQKLRDEFPEVAVRIELKG